MIERDKLHVGDLLGFPFQFPLVIPLYLVLLFPMVPIILGTTFTVHLFQILSLLPLLSLLVWKIMESVLSSE